MAAYVDYSYYTGTYLGTAIASADFAQAALRASAQIDALSFGRAAPIVSEATDTATIDKIKMATCAVAEELQKIGNEGANARLITSESIGSNSVSYAPVALQSDVDRLRAAAGLYLGSSGLLFRGFDTGEYGGEPDAD